MTEPSGPPTLEALYLAYQIISGHTRRTPVMTSRIFNEMTGAELFFKCENFQRAGAFKFRGACNVVFTLSEGDAAKGVVTHSSGNHGQALALAAQLRGVPARVVMPENASAVKKSAVAGYGAEIVSCAPTLQAREETTARIVGETGATLVHPYNDYRIIAGQGTAAVELLEDFPELDLVIAPVGGGGLLSGTALAAKEMCSETVVIGAEPSGADDAYQSLKEGRLIPQENPDTIADGLRTSLGDKTFPIIRDHVSEIVTVDDHAIVSAMKLTWERMKIVIEPSAAVPIAALLEGKVDVQGKRVGVIVSGGNVDLDRLPWVGV